MGNENNVDRGNAYDQINSHITEEDRKYISSYPRNVNRPITDGNSGDSIGIREMRFNLNEQNEPYPMRDTCIYGVPIEEIRKKCQ